MKKLIRFGDAIDEIERAYIKVAVEELYKRIQVYHRAEGGRIKIYTNDIRRLLSECIKGVSGKEPGDLKLSVKKQVDSIKPHADNHHVVFSVSDIPHQYNATELNVISKEDIDDLARYFRERSNGSGFHPAIEEKLMFSVWDHIHASIRYARMNIDNKAKMHVDIACSVCNELSHYMGETDYLDFVENVKSYLADIKLVKW